MNHTGIVIAGVGVALVLVLAPAGRPTEASHTTFVVNYIQDPGDTIRGTVCVPRRYSDGVACAPPSRKPTHTQGRIRSISPSAPGLQP